MKLPVLLFVAGAVALRGQTPAAKPAAAPAPESTCVQCHSAMEGAIQKPALLIKNDVHTTAGLTCVACHGGDGTAVEPEVSMSKAKGFIGKPKHADIPQLCGKCHSNPDYMRRFHPQQRVDQLELYKPSVHGKKLAAGDMNVATCIDCHSVHDIRAVKDATSPVHPKNIPETCGRCHADAAKMSQYKIPTNQLAEYKTSVHWDALSKRGDLSAPNCASCHGNHGAKPPQVASVSAVCGSCHVLFAQLYEKSVHQPIFGGGANGGGCTVCHSNHGIHKPSTAMLSGPKAVCTPCHEPGSTGASVAAQFAQSIDGLSSALDRASNKLKDAERYGMEVSTAQLELNDGHESLIKARLAVHSFDPEKVKKEVDAGMVVARKSLAAGETALRDKDTRRLGLAISALFIAITVVAIALVIKRLERTA
ncbi:MAG TPA: cytochrome c3 family protein [Bryobacteraceae bacterium]|nr:cytochrome c3 family protein [Bryobacteraceae bacterium]